MRNVWIARCLMLGCGLTLSIWAAAQTTADAARQAAVDASITAQIETTFLFNRHLNPFNINTTTTDGVVTLTGAVADEVQRELAENIASSVEAVKSVENNISVMGTVLSERKQRTWRQRVDDMTLAASIRSRLLYNKELKGLRIGVTSELGMVTLYGVVGTEAQKERIGTIADETQGVIEVKNELTVREREQRGTLSDTGRHISDEWIEKRVETAILLNRHLSVRGLNVDVIDNVCVLTGTVDALEEKDLAEALAGSISGVESVRNEIQIYKAPE
jgi:osmotically-inducible protein OsmY